MTRLELRREIKKAIDRLPAEELQSLADYVCFLSRPTLARRLQEAEKALESGQGRNWREVRSDV